MEYLIIEKKNGETIKLFGSKSPIKITKGEQRKKKLGENIITLSLESVKQIDFSIRDKITVFAEDYFLNLMPTMRKTGERRFAYDVIFESIQYDLAKSVFLDEDLSNKSTDSRFPLRANLREILEVIINNLNRDNAGLFRLGTCPDTDTRDFSYSDNNCLAILQQTCEAYETEFDIKKDVNKYIINIGKIGRTLPLTFRYGKGGGAYEIARQTISSSNIVTRLFTYGSDKNIPSDYRNFASRLRLGVNAKSYIEDAEAIKAFGIIEGVKTFDEIYPHREGTVTKISNDILSFTDSAMDFDLNEKDANGTKYLIDGTSAKITFNTGGLSGYTFEIVKDGGYNHSTKTFKLIQYKDDRGALFPNPDTTTYQIKVGDKYVITDIYPPQSYITAAEAKLLEKAKEYLKGNSAPRVQYSIGILESFLKKYAGSQTANIFEIGDYVGVVDPDININRTNDNAIRINSFTRDLLGNTPYAYTLEVSDVVEVDIIERIISEQSKVDTIIKINDLADVQKRKMSYKTTQELLNMVFDQEGYFKDGNIKPNSIETQMLSVGAKAQQMILRNTVIEANYQGNGNILRVDGGSLVHYGLFDTPKTWNITAQTTTITTGDGALYIYARCPKATGNAVILFEQEQKKVEDPNYYYFIVGVLHSIEDGVRWISLTYGSSSINGAFIKTGKIVSSDGENYIDLDNNQMRLGDSKSAIEWNKGGDKKLRIRGSVVVSPSGDESPAEVDRGDYSNLRVYYAGDKVWYNKIAYSCFKDAPIGTDPTNTAYWKPYGKDVAVGGRNLALNSKGSWGRTTYGTIQTLKLSTPLIVGETYIVTWKNIKTTGRLNSFFDMTGVSNNRQGISNGVSFKANNTYPYLTFFCENAPEMDLEIGEVMVEKANTSSSWSLAPEDIEQSISEANANANNALNQASQAQTDVNDLNIYVDGAFKDGVISEAEAKAIETHLKNVNDTMAQLEATYNKLYVNPYLEGTSKTALLNAKVNLFGARDNLVKAINDAIADGMTTIAEKNNVNSKYDLFNDTIRSFNTAVEDANKAIQDKLDSLSSERFSNGNIYVRGTGLNRNAGQILKINDKIIYNTSGRGLMLTIISRVNLSIIFRQQYDIYSNNDHRIALINKLNSLDSTVIVALTSCDAINIDANVANALANCGGGGKTFNGRYPYSLIGIPKIGKGAGLEVYYNLESDAPFAEIYTKVIDGIPQGINTNKDVLYKDVADAKTNADKAQTTANQAVSDAKESKDRLNEWAKDSVISPTEKTALRQQAEDIKSEYQEILSDVTRYKLTTTNQWADYYSAYTKAITALGKYTKTTPENIPVESDFADIANYYPKRQTVLELIAKTAKEYADDLINNLELGNRNFLLGTKEEKNVVKPGTGFGQLLYRYVDNLTKYSADDIYTLSFEAKPNTDGTLPFASIVIGSRTPTGDAWSYRLYPNSLQKTLLSDGYTRYIGLVDWKVSEGMRWNVGVNFIIEGSASGGSFRKMIFNRGNKASDWIQAQEELEDKINEANENANDALAEAQALEYLKKALEGSTTIDGGLLLTSMIQLGIIDANKFVEKAGINGTAKNDNDVVAWFGGTLQEAIQNLASIVFRLDGSAMFGKGAHQFGTDGSLSFGKGSFLYDLVNGLYIKGKIESNSDGDRVIIDPSTRSLKMINKYGHELVNLSFYDGTTYVPTLTMWDKDSNGKALSRTRMRGDKFRVDNLDIIDPKFVEITADRIRLTDGARIKDITARN